MSFLYPQAILPVMIIASVMIVSVYLYEKRYFSWVKLYWFHGRSWWSRLSSLFFLIGMTCLLISLLDLRGPEERVSTNVPDQKTIILIDASSSMLVEDVRPNRFERALFLARHFIRNAVGHQVSVVLFSDTTKRLISFTDDVDLLDTRISGLESTDLSSAGSNISLSLKESVNYFREQSDNEGPILGNVLLFTDGEETAQGVEESLPTEVALAVVGVGTSKGGPIPIRSKNGNFRGYKEYEGERVISSLDEEWLKAFGERHDLYKYWVALSYNVPTEKVLSFFEKVYNDRLSKGEMRYRPVLGFPLIIAFFILMSLSSLLSLFPSFDVEKKKNIARAIILAFVLASPFEPEMTAMAQEDKEGPKLSKKSRDLLQRLESGKDLHQLKLKLAESLMKDEQHEKALQVYNEVLSKNSVDKEREAYLNFLSLMLLVGDKNEAAKLLHEQQGAFKEDERSKMRENILYILNQQQNSKESKKSSENSEESEKSEEEKDSQGQGETKKQQEKSGEKSESESKDSEESKEENSQKEEGEGQKSDEEGDSEKSESEGDQAGDEQKPPENEDVPQSWGEKVEDIKSKKSMKKELPALLQQIQGQDRELQKQQIDTRTNQRSSGRKKDW